MYSIEMFVLPLDGPVFQHLYNVYSIICTLHVQSIYSQCSTRVCVWEELRQDSLKGVFYLYCSLWRKSWFIAIAQAVAHVIVVKDFTANSGYQLGPEEPYITQECNNNYLTVNTLPNSYSSSLEGWSSGWCEHTHYEEVLKLTLLCIVYLLYCIIRGKLLKVKGSGMFFQRESSYCVCDREYKSSELICIMFLKLFWCVLSCVSWHLIVWLC